MTADSAAMKVLVMGVVNTLLQDDGVGIHVTESLKAAADDTLELVDAGTLGLSLLPQIEGRDAVIVVDAAEIGQPPGTICIFRDREIDAQLSGKRRTVHEVALSDLFAAASMRGKSPLRRALIAIQPASTDWGLEPTEPVREAIPRACAVIASLAREWQAEARRHG